jgi:hypothetical protein
MASTKAFENTLGETKFFAIHRIIESEHIRLSVSNWLRFCKTPQEKTEFMEGTHIGLMFWKQYWSCVSDAIDRKKGKRA